MSEILSPQYTVVVGQHQVFQIAINDLSKKGFVPFGNLNTNITENQNLLFSQLMVKYESPRTLDSAPTDES